MLALDGSPAHLRLHGVAASGVLNEAGEVATVVAHLRHGFDALLVALFVEHVVMAWRRTGRDHWPTVVAFAGAALLLRLYQPGRKPILLLGTSAGLAAVVTSFPTTANHSYLLLAALVLCAAGELGPGARAGRWLLWLRSLPVLVTLGAGVQKLLYGLYDRGEYAAYAAANQDERFSRLYRLLGEPPPPTIAAAGDPVGWPTSFQLTTALGRAGSIAVVALELSVPLLVLWPRTAPLGLALLAAMLVGMQLLARELTFVLVMLVLLSLHLPAVRQRWVLMALIGAAAVWAIATVTMGFRAAAPFTN